MTNIKETELKLNLIFFTIYCFDPIVFYLLKNENNSLDESSLKKLKETLLLKIKKFKTFLVLYFLELLYTYPQNLSESAEYFMVKNYLKNFQYIDQVFKKTDLNKLYKKNNVFCYKDLELNLEGPNLISLMAIDFLEDYLSS